MPIEAIAQSCKTDDGRSQFESRRREPKEPGLCSSGFCHSRGLSSRLWVNQMVRSRYFTREWKRVQAFGSTKWRKGKACLPLVGDPPWVRLYPGRFSSRIFNHRGTRCVPRAESEAVAWRCGCVAGEAFGGPLSSYCATLNNGESGTYKVPKMNRTGEGCLPRRALGAHLLTRKRSHSNRRAHSGGILSGNSCQKRSNTTSPRGGV